MNQSEAIQKMRQGAFITHDHFASNEWMTISNGNVVFEDGSRCSISKFFAEGQPDKEDYSIKEVPVFEKDGDRYVIVPQNWPNDFHIHVDDMMLINNPHPDSSIKNKVEACYIINHDERGLVSSYQYFIFASKERGVGHCSGQYPKSMCQKLMKL